MLAQNGTFCSCGSCHPDPGTTASKYRVRLCCLQDRRALLIQRRAPAGTGSCASTEPALPALLIRAETLTRTHTASGHILPQPSPVIGPWRSQACHYCPAYLCQDPCCALAWPACICRDLGRPITTRPCVSSFSPPEHPPGSTGSGSYRAAEHPHLPNLNIACSDPLPVPVSLFTFFLLRLVSASFPSDCCLLASRR